MSTLGRASAAAHHRDAGPAPASQTGSAFASADGRIGSFCVGICRVDADGRADAIAAYQYGDGTFRYHVWKGTGTTMTYGGSTGWYTSGSFRLGNVGGRLVAGDWNGN